MSYETIIIGGGIAGLQAAIQLGRYRHRVLVIDADYGRSTLCRSYHNILGYPEGVSGEHLRAMGRKQAEALGVEFLQDEVIEASKTEEEYVLQVRSSVHTAYRASTLLLATGVMDRFPELPNLKACFGISVYVCPDCDGYEVRNRNTVVMGAGDVGAEMAVVLKYWTDRITYVNHSKEKKPVSSQWQLRLQNEKIHYIEASIEKVILDGEPSQGLLAGILLDDGRHILAERGFIAFGGNQVKTNLAAMLGIERLENKHIVTNPRTKETSVSRVWAAGDIGVHAEQVTIAMGEGSLAAIWIHKALMAL
jgi:thioredoxin reductase (NADPH)